MSEPEEPSPNPFRGASSGAAGSTPVSSGQEASITPSIAPALPTAISVRYEILGEAGRGGMGIVYKARDRETGETVALKVLKPEIAADPAVMERFKNELRLARRITHKNVCRLHEFNRVGDVAYITMEFVEGESLRARLRRDGSPGLRTCLDLARQIADGLQEAHRQGVVHRDLKPENVLVLPDGWVKVMDFGIARSLDASNLTLTLVGTPAYMAPEQARGQRADHRADIYSFGLLLYEMVTGSPAFQADTPMAMLLQQIQEAPRPPQEITPALPDRLGRLILRCLEKDPNNRFATTSELVAELASNDLGADLTGDAASADSQLRPASREAPAPHSDRATPSRATAQTAETEFTLSRGTARALFLTIQVGYLGIYCAAAYYVESLQRALAGFLNTGAGTGAPFVVVAAMCGVSVRLYLLSSVGLDHRAAGRKFQRLFPALFLLDTLWAVSPLLLAQNIGYGLALVAVSALAYLPFAQRTLMQSISPAETA